jgi:hypothetical protein
MPYNIYTTCPNDNAHITHAVCGRLFSHRISKLTFPIRLCRKWNLSRQIRPGLSSLSLLLYSFSSQAVMSQTTLNVIEGSAPYLTFDGGVTRATNTDELLGITLPGGTRITPSSNPSSLSSPIQLQADNVRFTDIGMFVPIDTDSVALNTLIGPPYNYWRDDDGDSDVTATGHLTLSIVDKNSHSVTRGEVLTRCNAPYQVKLDSSAGTLSTRYGFPKYSNFSQSSVVYYINPKPSPAVCFARPSLKYGSNSDNAWGADFAGPLNIWDPTKGFLTQSADSAHYDLNFPTTGAHNLYFDLDIGGAGALTWAPVTAGGVAGVNGITATMMPDPSGTSVRVTLTGPHASSTQISSSSPSNIPYPSLPAAFKLVGKDNGGREIVTYGFVLKQWFVSRGNKTSPASDQASWCTHIGYQMPKVKWLTNAQCVGLWASSSCRGSDGASPSSAANHYQRNIGAGFFTEWGDMPSYAIGIGFVGGNHWVSDTAGSNLFSVHSSTGEVKHFSPYVSHYVVCASDLSP